MPTTQTCGNEFGPQRSQRVVGPVSARPGDLGLGEEFLHFAEFVFRIAGEADEDHAPLVEHVVRFDQVGRFGLARAAPMGPGVDDQHLSLQAIGSRPRAVEPAFGPDRRHRLPLAQAAAGRDLLTQKHRKGQADKRDRDYDQQQPDEFAARGRRRAGRAACDMRRVLFRTPGRATRLELRRRGDAK